MRPVPSGGRRVMQRFAKEEMAMDQHLWLPCLGGWTSIYQLFWCSSGVQGFDTLPNGGSTWLTSKCCFLGKISGVRSEILECLTVCPSKYGSFTYHLWNLYHQNDSSFAGKEKALKIVVMHKIAKETWRWKQQGHGPKCFKFATWVLPILPRSAQICFLVSKLQVLPTHVGTCWLHVYYYSDAIDPDNCQMQSLPASSESQGYRPTSPLLAAD